MTKESSDSILEIALEINGLVRCAKILDHFRKNILEWCKREEHKARRQSKPDAPLVGLYRKLSK